MTSVFSKRALSPFFFAAAVASLLNCGGGGRKESFSAEGDAKVMASVTGIWMGTSASGKTYTLTLCENLAADHTDGNACDTLHVVRGGGRGTTETTEEPTGCGGCDYSYSAFVDGTIEGDDLVQTTLKGEFDLASGDANETGLPYLFTADSDARVAGKYNSVPAVSIELGHVNQPGVMDVERFVYPPMGAPVGADAAATADSGADSGDADASAPSDVDAAAQAYDSPQVTVTDLEFHRIGDASCPTQ